MGKLKLLLGASILTLVSVQVNAVDDATTQTIGSKASSANSKADGNNSRIQALEAEDVLINQRIDDIQLLPGPKGDKGDKGDPGDDAAGPIVETRSPDPFDDISQDYSVGTLWVDTTQGAAYIMIDNAPGSAVWKLITNTPTLYAIGDTGPAGGIVFYISDGGVHGLEASLEDQSATLAEWGCYGTRMSAGSDLYPLDLKPIGMGVPNTLDILAGCPTVGIAARLADNFELNGYTDWFLPSKAELELLYSRQTIVGGFANSAYWSSSEDSDSVAWFKNFGTGNQNKSVKNGLLRVRAIRAF